MKTAEKMQSLRIHLRVIVLTLGLLVALSGPLAIQPALASAPPLATVTTSADLFATSDPASPVLTRLVAGAEVTLTGTAAGDLLEIIAGDYHGWIGVDDLDDGRFDTAQLALDANLHGSARADGEILQQVPFGSTVTLTGASLDGYLAATYGGVGGWISAGALS